jgi:hypothetical protein
LYEELNAKDQLNFLVKVAPYMMPALNSVDITEVEPLSEEDSWETLIMDYGDRVETRQIKVTPFQKQGRRSRHKFP